MSRLASIAQHSPALVAHSPGHLRRLESASDGEMRDSRRARRALPLPDAHVTLATVDSSNALSAADIEPVRSRRHSHATASHLPPASADYHDGTDASQPLLGQ